jgi:hypothetical protein
MKFSIHKQVSKPVKIAVYAVVIIVVLAAAYLILDRAGYIKAFQLGMQLQQQQQQQSEDKMVLENLGKIILLPTDVTPTMAVINDIEALKKEQPAFFSDAKNGDRVVLYPTMAIVYDYQANKIIHVGPVQTTPAEEKQPASDAETTGGELPANVDEVPAE